MYFILTLHAARAYRLTVAGSQGSARGQTAAATQRIRNTPTPKIPAHGPDVKVPTGSQVKEAHAS